MTGFHTIALAGSECVLDLAAGHIRRLALSDAGRTLSPFHVAPWIDDPAVASDHSLPVSLRHLAGDFFCAPFAANDVEDAPLHGWPANSPWDIVESDAGHDSATGLYRLRKTVFGATVEKRLTLRRDHPFLYETHSFVGGEGMIPVANHAMAALPAGGRLAFSPKRRIETPATALEPDPAQGRSVLAYPATTTDPTRVALRGGGVADITRFPFAERHDDFAMLIEAPGHVLGWCSASRPATRDAVLSLKNPQDFPVTFLWWSNGGRDYSPWNGRHTDVLGIEEGRSFSLGGHRASAARNPLSEAGIPTALSLVPNSRVEVRNVIGAIALPDSGDSVAAVTDEGSTLCVRFVNGTGRAVPFDSDFLAGA